MTSSDHHRTSPSAAIEDEEGDEDEYEYEYEEIEVEEEEEEEEEIDEEVEQEDGIDVEEEEELEEEEDEEEPEEEEEDPEEDESVMDELKEKEVEEEEEEPEEEEAEDDESVMDVFKEQEVEEEEDEEEPEEEEAEEDELVMDGLKEKEAEEDPETEQENDDEDEEVEDDEDKDEDEQVESAEEETDIGAPNSSIVAPIEPNDVSQDLLLEKQEDDFVLSNPMTSPETLPLSKSNCEVHMTGDERSGQLERPNRLLELQIEDQTAREDVLVSNGCQLERLTKKVELDTEDQSARDDVLVSNGCQLEVHAENDRDIDLSQTLKIAQIDSQEKDCSGNKGANLDKLMIVKDSQVSDSNEKETIPQTSLKGDTGFEINPIPDAMEIDEKSDMQPVDEISKTCSRFSAPLTRSRTRSPETEANNREKRPAIICEFFAKGWCIKGSTCRFLHKRDNTGNSSQMLGEDTVKNSGGSSPHGSGLVTSSMDTAGGVPKHKVSSDMPVICRINPEAHSNLSDHQNGFRGFGFPMEQSSLRHCNYLHNDRNASALGYSMNNSRMPDWRNNISNNPYLRQEFFVPHKASTGFNGEYAFRSLLTPSGAASNITMEPRLSYAYKSKFIPYNWEPSTPFRPYSSVPSTSTSSHGCQYDPIRDSIQQAEEDTLVKPPSHGKSYSSDTEKRRSSDDKKDTPVVELEAESAAASATDAQALTSIPKDVVSGSNHQHSASRLRIEQKVEKEWQSSEVDLDPAEFEAIHRESKAMKHFRAAVVVFVKDLLRPMWHDGLLSKDAFKIIVQKAEEKIVNSLQTSHMPSTAEQINQYLSSSQTKIVKLLEGYASKYRKSLSSQPVV